MPMTEITKRSLQCCAPRSFSTSTKKCPAQRRGDPKSSWMGQFSRHTQSAYKRFKRAGSGSSGGGRTPKACSSVHRSHIDAISSQNASSVMFACSIASSTLATFLLISAAASSRILGSALRCPDATAAPPCNLRCSCPNCRRSSSKRRFSFTRGASRGARQAAKYWPNSTTRSYLSCSSASTSPTKKATGGDSGRPSSVRR
mmetsp:Transcript_94606/g.272410  ORF Transcript_94606/g.272410 Transcript_94606/m.272410 type:complete len:201 (-) Transcript_94606:194-796(-)